jgi:putative iron-dependent peroxidase
MNGLIHLLIANGWIKRDFIDAHTVRNEHQCEHRMRMPAAPFPQPVLAPLTSAAIFLVVCIKPDRESYATVRSLCADLPGIFRAVDFRRIEGGLSCVASFGSDAWDKLFGKPRPPELHPFREIRSGERHAVSTPADLLFHLRAKRMDMCFELVAQIVKILAANE